MVVQRWLGAACDGGGGPAVYQLIRPARRVALAVIDARWVISTAYGEGGVRGTIRM